jgi:hypothetical protein
LNSRTSTVQGNFWQGEHCCYRNMLFACSHRIPRGPLSCVSVRPQATAVNRPTKLFLGHHQARDCMGMDQVSQMLVLSQPLMWLVAQGQFCEVSV